MKKTAKNSPFWLFVAKKSTFSGVRCLKLPFLVVFKTELAVFAKFSTFLLKFTIQNPHFCEIFNTFPNYREIFNIFLSNDG